MSRTASAEQLTFVVNAPTSANRRTAERQRRALTKAAEVFQELFDQLSPEQLEALAEGVREAAAAPAEETERARFVREFAAADAYGQDERVRLRFETLVRSFARRQELLKDSLTAPEVAKLLNVSRQTPHDRVESGSLLAVLDRGAQRFPEWQFDPDGPDGVVPGLPDAIRALTLPPLAKINWFVRSNPYLEGRRPIDALRQGDRERVLDTARGVGLA